MKIKSAKIIKIPIVYKSQATTDLNIKLNIDPNFIAKAKQFAERSNFADLINAAIQEYINK